jgi:hypothetical protein
VTQAAYPRVALQQLAPLQRESIRRNNRREAGTARTLTRRAGPALPSYLALHHAGFSVPRVLPPERWALTPPFHPCQADELCEDVSQVFLRDVTVLRAAGGTFSVALSVSEPASASRNLRHPNRTPGVTRRVALALHPRLGG